MENERSEIITSGEIADACSKAYVKAGHNAYFANGFEAGVEFAIEKLRHTSHPDEFVILAKPNYLHKDGSIKPARKATIDGMRAYIVRKYDLYEKR